MSTHTEVRSTDEGDRDAWVLLAETRAVRVYGLRKPASLRDVLKDRERMAGKPSAKREETK